MQTSDCMLKAAALDKQADGTLLGDGFKESCKCKTASIHESAFQNFNVTSQLHSASQQKQWRHRNAHIWE